MRSKHPQRFPMLTLFCNFVFVCLFVFGPSCLEDLFRAPDLPGCKSSAMLSIYQPALWLRGFTYGTLELPSSSQCPQFWSFLPDPVKVCACDLPPITSLGLEPKPWDNLQQIPSSWLLDWGWSGLRPPASEPGSIENAYSWVLPYPFWIRTAEWGPRNLYFG